jgi:hypothetical protein
VGGVAETCYMASVTSRKGQTLIQQKHNDKKTTKAPRPHSEHQPPIDVLQYQDRPSSGQLGSYMDHVSMDDAHRKPPLIHRPLKQLLR